MAPEMEISVQTQSKSATIVWLNLRDWCNSKKIEENVIKSCKRQIRRQKSLRFEN